MNPTDWLWCTPDMVERHLAGVRAGILLVAGQLRMALRLVTPPRA